MLLLQNIFRLFPFSPAYFRNRNALLFSSVSVGFMLLATSCGNTEKELSEYNRKSLGIEEIRNADINYTLGGKAKAKLQSALMLRIQDANPYVEFPKKLHVDFFNETGTVDSRLDAFYG
jgi:hypothetical protein